MPPIRPPAINVARFCSAPCFLFRNRANADSAKLEVTLRREPGDEQGIMHIGFVRWSVADGARFYCGNKILRGDGREEFQFRHLVGAKVRPQDTPADSAQAPLDLGEFHFWVRH